jgi:hypothetical protein
MGLKLRRAAPPPPPGGTPAAPGKPPATNAGADDDANEDEDEDDDEDAPLRNRADAVSAGNEERFYAAAGARLAEADRAALAPLLERVAAIAQTDDAAAGADALEKLRADLPALEKQCLGDAATAELEDAFSAILGAAVADGLATAATGADTGGRPLANMAPRHGDTDWDESDYVRDEEGKFAPKGGGASGASPSRMKGKARERVIAAIKEAHRRKGEVHGAIEITGLGKVSVGLGASGDKDNEFKGGWGAAHWEGKHAESTAVAVADLLTKGRVMPGQTADKREIHHNGWKGVLAKKSKGNWRLVTVFNAGK